MKLRGTQAADGRLTIMVEPSEADQRADAWFCFTLEACAASCGRVQSLKLILAKRELLLLQGSAAPMLHNGQCGILHLGGHVSAFPVALSWPPCAGRALHPSANQAEELAPAVSGAVDVPGLPFVAEQVSKGTSVPRPPSPAQPAAPQEDTCALLRQRLGLPQPWPLEIPHLACVCSLLRAGAGLTPRQWQRVLAACKQLRGQQVGSLGSCCASFAARQSCACLAATLC